MNKVTFKTTVDDFIELQEWQNQRKNKFSQRPFPLIVLLGLLFFIAFLTLSSLSTLSVFLFLMLTIYSITVYLNFPKYQQKALRAQLESTIQKHETITVSLTPRGVLETDDCEERLTLYDAIEETELTEKFLYAKDKRGGILLIPLRAFGGEVEARTFLIEFQNRRMQSAVGLAAPVPVLVEQPSPQPWWKVQAAKTQNDVDLFQKINKNGN
jgi:hypothetical protein